MRSKLFCLVLTLAFILSLTGCSLNGEKPGRNSDFDFMSYEDDNLYNIEKLDLNNKLTSVCTSYSFIYSSDEYSVEGYISIPNDCVENETPYKCILFSRGGNSDYGRMSDDYVATICRNTDRVVIASQYRSKDEYGGADISDVTTLIDFCDKKFKFVSMDDFCAMGLSRGGMMSYIAARDDSRIKKLVAVAADSDLIDSYYCENIKMRELLEQGIGGSPEELPDEYTNRSANCWAEKIKVPVLIIHSKDDAMVSYSQSEEMYQKFKKNGNNCKLITHDDDVHNFHSEDWKYIREWLND